MYTGLVHAMPLKTDLSCCPVGSAAMLTPTYNTLGETSLVQRSYWWGCVWLGDSHGLHGVASAGTSCRIHTEM